MDQSELEFYSPRVCIGSPGRWPTRSGVPYPGKPVPKFGRLGFCNPGKLGFCCPGWLIGLVSSTGSRGSTWDKIVRVSKTLQKDTWWMSPGKLGWSHRSEGPTRSERTHLSSLHTSFFKCFLLFSCIIQLSSSISLTLILTWVGEGKPWWIGEQLCNLRDDLTGELDDQEVDAILKDHSTKAFEEARKTLLLHRKYNLTLIIWGSPEGLWRSSQPHPHI